MRSPRLTLVVALGAALFAAGGCQIIDDAAAPIDRARLIEDMSRQLDRGRDFRNLAEYQLSGGVQATVTHDTAPVRTAYAFPGGLMVLESEASTSCQTATKPVRCQVQAVPEKIPVADFAEMTKQGLIATPVVADLLRVTALQPLAAVKQHDTTLAGQQATCLDVSGLSDAPTAEFSACVTSDGVLASFAATVNGAKVDMALTRLVRKVPEDAFALPQGAQVVDRRKA